MLWGNETMATQREIWQIKEKLIEIVLAETPITKRGAFYRAVSTGLFPSTGERDYSLPAPRIAVSIIGQFTPPRQFSRMIIGRPERRALENDSSRDPTPFLLFGGAIVYGISL
jgi:hypothetical protein